MINTAQTNYSTRYSEALRAARGLLLYRNLRKDPVFLAVIRFLETITGEARQEEVLDAYGDLFFLLSENAAGAGGRPQGDAWQNYLLDSILYDDNAFSRGAAAVPLEKLGLSLRDAAAGDLRRLQCLYQADAASAREGVLLKLGTERLPAGGLPAWLDLAVLTPADVPEHQPGREIKAFMARSEDWGRCLEELSRYYRRAGSGVFGRYGAFRWESSGARLEGITEPDPIRFEELIGYRPQRQEVEENTERFLAGQPANNMLLYGDRGTGKSSTVKALLNRYRDRGLKLVEVTKGALGDFPVIIRQLRERPQRFIIFVDDLSFEESEVEYKELKAVLEGGLESRPSNVLIYATSNRRHLVRERFTDREPVPGEDGDVRGNDTIQEKLSLADRFGITVLFPTPDQALYLDIVRGLAEQRGLTLGRSELERQALLWEAWHNGRSGRTARQFIDQISVAGSMDRNEAAER